MNLVSLLALRVPFLISRPLIKEVIILSFFFNMQYHNPLKFTPLAFTGALINRYVLVLVRRQIVFKSKIQIITSSGPSVLTDVVVLPFKVLLFPTMLSIMTRYSWTHSWFSTLLRLPGKCLKMVTGTGWSFTSIYHKIVLLTSTHLP
jgi:hypothetical protein